MVDLTNSTQIIPYSYFRNMCGYYFLYKQYYKEDPEIVVIGRDYVIFKCFEEMVNRVTKYVKEQKKLPKQVIVNRVLPKNHPKPMTSYKKKHTTTYKQKNRPIKPEKREKNELFRFILLK